ncbi:MAG: hypothetical protein ACLP9L_27475 [Thermoguttaceae bacterium]
MKTTWTKFTTSLVLAGSLLAVEAQAAGISHGSFSAGSSHSANFATVQNSHQGKFNSSISRSTSQVLANHNPINGPTKISPANDPNKTGHVDKLNLKQELASKASKGNKNFDKLTYAKGMKNKWKPSKFWWGFGGFGWGGWFGWDGCWNDWYCGGCWPGYCCQPWYYSPCYNVCCEYYEPEYPFCISAPAVETVDIVNPTETQATLGFTVNGQTYSLEAGKTQELELTQNMVIEFNRGSDNNTGRYALSEGVYRFASTPQGWELYKSNDASLADAVAAN